MATKRFLALSLLIATLSTLAPAFATPVQAQLFGGIVSDPVTEANTGALVGLQTSEQTQNIALRIAKAAALAGAQVLIDKMVQSTIQWAQSGFEGNPAYATDPSQFFTTVADDAAGQFIYQNPKLNFLCSPFQKNIKLSIVQEYYQPQLYQCTLTQVVGNIDNFYRDFSQGGWDAWFSMTQQPTNNPYGAYLQARLDFQSQIASAVGLKTQQLNWNQGFLSWSDCVETNPAPTINVPSHIDPETGDPTLPSTQTNPAYLPGKAVGDCIKRGPIKTPGTVIAAQLNQALPSGLNKLINAQDIDQLISGFAAGLLQKFVFGPDGLFNRSDSKAATTPAKSAIDIDGDGVPDGLDNNNDGQLDVCYYGGLSAGSVTPPCMGSKQFNTPPSQAANPTNPAPSPDQPAPTQ